MGNAHASMNMTSPLSMGDFGQMGWERGCRWVERVRVLQALAMLCGWQECGLSAGHFSSKGKCAQPPAVLAQGSCQKGSTPRWFHSELSYNTRTTFGGEIPAGGLNPDTPLLKVLKTEDVVETPRRGFRVAEQRAQWITPWDIINCGNPSISWGNR